MPPDKGVDPWAAGEPGREGTMNVSGWIRKKIAGCLVVMLAIPFGASAAAMGQQAPASGQAQQAPASGQTPSSSPAQVGDAQTAPAQDKSAKPVGTAIAPAETSNGVTASMPAGAAIAPAKQRRVRAILIKVGVIVAAGVAIGTVAALSHSSSSQPH
jgi:hypothetical protein